MGEMALRFDAFTFAYRSAGDEGAAGVPGSGRGAESSRPFTLGPLTWEVAPGEFVLLVGGTGSGKTTLLRSAVPAIAPRGERGGAVSVFGEDVMAGGSASSLVGFVAQSTDNQLVCDTVWHQMAFGLENLGTPQAVMRRRVAEVAHFFGMESWFDSEVNSLSGGQRQLLNLASVLAMNPRVLLLDEPTARLDPVASRTIAHALFRLNRELGMTIVLATHEPEVLAPYATSCVRLGDGGLKDVSPEEFHRVVNEPHAVREKSRALDDTCPDVVKISDAYVRYRRGERWVMRGLDFTVARGSIHAVVGGNGCGKSTLLASIAGIMKPERGSIRNTSSKSQAYLPQDVKALFVADTVGEELREWQGSCGYSDAEIASALEAIGLEGAQDRHPYDLSGGQQQLLALTKLLITRPSLLLLDEPTCGLDASHKVEVAHLLEDFAIQGGTTILVTHDLAFAARVADMTSMMFDGNMTCTQPTADFFAENLFYVPVPDEFTRLYSRASRDVKEQSPC